MGELKNAVGLHEFFITACIELALIAKTRGDSPVGAVIVKKGMIVAKGIESVKLHNDVTFHAEILAIREAVDLLKTQDLSGCTMYTTHEPCIMCSYVIRHTKISMVVTGVTSGETGGFHSSYPILADQSIKKWGPPPMIISGILEKECRELSQ